MFNPAHILIGLIMVGIGIAMVKFTFQMVNVTGNQQWIEKYVGGGSTYGVFKLFGVFLVIAGLLFATGFGANLMDFLFSPLKSIFKPVGQ